MLLEKIIIYKTMIFKEMLGKIVTIYIDDKLEKFVRIFNS